GFNAASVAWFNAQGNGTITGQAILRTNGGEARTCAGLKVLLEPKSAYADERMLALYGSTDHGYSPATARKVKFSPDALAYHKINRTTTCDAQGNLSFANLPAGHYYIVAPVVWKVGYAVQGGYLMRSVTLAAGANKHVIL